MKIAPQDWPLVTGMVMTALNEALLPRLGKRDDATFRTPLKVFTSLKPVRTQMLYAAVYNDAGLDSGHDGVSLDRFRALQVMNIESLQTSFQEMHKI